MICPNDLTQMHQYKKLGGGYSGEEKYETWEIKICPECKRLTKEYYSAEILSEGNLKKIINEKKLEEGEDI